MDWIDWMIRTLPAITAVLYAAVGVGYLLKKDFAWATVWLAYAVANVGLVLAGMKGVENAVS